MAAYVDEEDEHGLDGGCGHDDGGKADGRHVGHPLQHAELVHAHLGDSLAEGQLPGVVLDDADAAEDLVHQLHSHVREANLLPSKRLQSGEEDAVGGEEEEHVAYANESGLPHLEVDEHDADHDLQRRDDRVGEEVHEHLQLLGVVAEHVHDLPRAGGGPGRGGQSECLAVDGDGEGVAELDAHRGHDGVGVGVEDAAHLEDDPHEGHQHPGGAVGDVVRVLQVLRQLVQNQDRAVGQSRVDCEEAYSRSYGAPADCAPEHQPKTPLLPGLAALQLPGLREPLVQQDAVVVAGDRAEVLELQHLGVAHPVDVAEVAEDEVGEPAVVVDAGEVDWRGRELVLGAHRGHSRCKVVRAGRGVGLRRSLVSN